MQTSIVTEWPTQITAEKRSENQFLQKTFSCGSTPGTQKGETLRVSSGFCVIPLQAICLNGLMGSWRNGRKGKLRVAKVGTYLRKWGKRERKRSAWDLLLCTVFVAQIWGKSRVPPWISLMSFKNLHYCCVFFSPCLFFRSICDQLVESFILKLPCSGFLP